MSNQRTLVGRVTSNKMQKTVTVRVERRVRDALMGRVGGQWTADDRSGWPRRTSNFP